MSYSRGKFGIEYTQTQRDDHESHPLRYVILVLTMLVTVSFLWTWYSRPKPAEPKEPSQEPMPVTTFHTPATKPKVQNPKPPAIERASTPTPQPTNPAPARIAVQPPSPPALTPSTPQVNLNRDKRPSAERVLLDRLADAERTSNAIIAIDTLEKLRTRPAMADLSDRFSRRLGRLNMERLLSSRRTQWTSDVVVKRGDNVHRLAREHGSTYAALLKLNPGLDPNRIKPGDHIRLIEFPHASLAIHRSAGFADLSLKGRFFSRYSVTCSKRSKLGEHPITRDAGPRTRFSELDVKFSPSDLAELDLFLAPGSSISISEQ